MPDFTYKALRGDGSMAEGTLAAKDKAEACRKLVHSGMQPFQVSEGGGGAPARAAKPKAKAENKPAKTAGAKAAKPGPKGKLRLSASQVIFFTEELSDLLSAGVQLEPSLKMMEGRGASGPVRAVTARIREQVRDGVSLSRAMAAASPSFGPLYCNLVAAGEAGGALADILKRQIRYLTTLQELRAKVLTAMIYPAFLFFSGLAVTVLFISFLVPRLTGLIESSGGEVPFAVQLLIDTTAFTSRWWWALLAGLALLAGGLVAATRHPALRPGWDKLRLRVPLFGTLQLRRFHVQFLETLSNLLGNGMSLVRSLHLCEGGTRNVHIQRQLAQISAQVADGASLHRCLEKSGVFPVTLIDMIRIGEHTGQLNESLSKAGERLDRDLNRSVERISAFVQPVIIVMMALVVGTMAYLMITVIYDTISILRSR